MGKLYLFTLLSLATLGVVIGFFVWLSVCDQESDYHGIHLGMLGSHVEARIGSPGGYLSRKRIIEIGLRAGTLNKPLPIGDLVEGDRFSSNTFSTVTWNRRNGTLRVGFDMGGRVIWKHFTPLPEETLLDRFRDWVRLD